MRCNGPGWRAVVATVCVALAASSCKTSAPAQLRSLLQQGKTSQAKQLIADELPDLVAKGKLSEANELVLVVRDNDDALPASAASDLRESTGREYLEGISSTARDLPLGEICQIAVNQLSVPTRYSSIEAALADAERRRNLANLCEALGYA